MISIVVLMVMIRCDPVCGLLTCVEGLEGVQPATGIGFGVPKSLPSVYFLVISILGLSSRSSSQGAGEIDQSNKSDQQIHKS